MTARACALVALLLLPSLIFGTSAKPSAVDLAEISQRGILLAGYDKAAWHATDAVMALHPQEDTVGRYIATETTAGWAVAFGRLNATNDEFLVAYEATQTDDPIHFDVKKYDPPRQDLGFNLAGARAIGMALKDFRGANCPYNVAVLPAEHGELFVYVYPAQVKPGVYPYGADVRYLFSSDGTAIVAKRQLHQALLESVPGKSKGTFAGGYHVHTLSDTPEDTDVLLVLTREPRAPEVVVAGGHAFIIDVNGKIRDAGGTGSR
jgi:hypothetical protein